MINIPVPDAALWKGEPRFVIIAGKYRARNLAGTNFPKRASFSLASVPKRSRDKRIITPRGAPLRVASPQSPETEISES